MTLLTFCFYIAKFHPSQKSHPTQAVKWHWQSSLGVKTAQLCFMEKKKNQHSLLTAWRWILQRLYFQKTSSIQSLSPSNTKVQLFRTRKLKADPSHTVANTLTPHRAGQCSASTLSVRHAGMLLIRCIRGTLVTYFAWQSHALLLNTKTRLKIFKYFKNIICSTCFQAFGTISPMLVHSIFSALLLACFFSFFFSSLSQTFILHASLYSPTSWHCPLPCNKQQPCLPFSNTEAMY